MAQLIDFCTRHPLLALATILALCSLVIYEIRMRGRSGMSVPAQRAVQLINQGATVVDLRDAALFDRAHIADSVNLAPDTLTAQAESKLKKKRPVLLVCESGAVSARQVNRLRQAGFENTWALDGGLSAWLRDNLPVVASRQKS